MSERFQVCLGYLISEFSNTDDYLDKLDMHRLFKAIRHLFLARLIEFPDDLKPLIADYIPVKPLVGLLISQRNSRCLYHSLGGQIISVSTVFSLDEGCPPIEYESRIEKVLVKFHSRIDDFEYHRRIDDFEYHRRIDDFEYHRRIVFHQNDYDLRPARIQLHSLIEYHRRGRYEKRENRKWYLQLHNPKNIQFKHPQNKKT